MMLFEHLGFQPKGVYALSSRPDKRAPPTRERACAVSQPFTMVVSTGTQHGGYLVVSCYGMA